MNHLHRTIIALFFAALLFMIPSLLWAQPPRPSPSPPPGPPPLIAEEQHKPTPLTKMSAGIFLLGDIEIDKKNRSVSFPALVNMDKGLLEYLLVQTGGKTHESLFRTTVRPYDLQIAFLLVGFEGTDSPLSSQGASESPTGDPVTITVSYVKPDGKSATIHPEDWIVKVKENTPENVDTLDWVYTGSIVVDGRFLAQIDGSVIAIYHDPVAMIDNATEGGETDKVWFVKEGATPPVGTPVVLTIKGRK